MASSERAAVKTRTLIIVYAVLLTLMAIPFAMIGIAQIGRIEGWDSPPWP